MVNFKIMMVIYMDEWKVGDPADWGDHVGVPDKPYMGYLNSDDDDYDEEPPWEPSYERERYLKKEERLGQEARSLYRKCQYKKALEVIERALEINRKNAENWNIRGKIMCGMKRFKASERSFDKSLELEYSGIVVGNKACMIRRWAWEYYDNDDMKNAMKLCRRAMKLVEEHDTDEDIEDYEFLKESIEAKV